MRGRTVARVLVAGGLLGAQLLLLAGVVAAADIISAGPLTHVIVTPDLNCQVAHVEDQAYEFFAPTDPVGSCGTFLAVGDSLYAPAIVSSGSYPLLQTAWAPVSQSAVLGNGSAGDPFRVVTTVDATGTGLRVEQSDSYVLGTQSFRTDIKISNLGSVAQAGVLYRAGDCFLQEDDAGFGRVDSGAPACVVSAASDARIEQWTPLTPGSSYMEGGYGDVFFSINGDPYPNTCICTYGDFDAHDNGAGLSWPIALGPGQTATYSHDTYFSPRGRAPVVESFTSSVPDPTQITLDPIVVAESVAVAAGVILLVPFPSALFNSTLEENYEEVMAGVNRIRRRLRELWLALLGRARTEVAKRRAARAASVDTPAAPAVSGSSAAAAPGPILTTADHPLGGPFPPTLEPRPALALEPTVAADSTNPAGPEATPRTTAMVESSVPGEPQVTPQPTPEQAARDVWRTPLGILGFIAASALLYAFLDPTFGLSLVSLATLLGLVLGLVVILVAYGVPLMLFSRNHALGLTVRALPATLIVAVGCVMVSRIANFQPGYVYGLVVGFFFVHSVTREIEGKAEAAAAGASLASAFVAWVVLALLRGGLAGDDAFVGALLQSATVTVVVAGLENAVFAMLPLRFLPGSAVFDWDRRVWVILLGLGVFGFAHVLLNPAAGAGYLADTTRTSFFTLIVLLVAFGIVSVVFWAWFRFRPARPHAGGPAL